MKDKKAMPENTISKEVKKVVAQATKDTDEESNKYKEFAVPADIASFIGITLHSLYAIVTDKRRYYRQFKIPKSNGKMRQISAPNEYLKAILKKLNEEVYFKVPRSKISFGYIKGVSPLEAVKMHTNKKIVCKVDIHDFFGTTNTAKIKRAMMKHMGYSQDVAYVLAVLATLDGKMPQGSPTSPAISNLVMYDFDNKLQQMLPGWDISRYVDDVIISTNNLVDPFQAIDQIKNLLKKFGYTMNEKKTRVMFSSQRQSVFGLVVNKKLNFSVQKYKLLRAKVHNFAKDPTDMHKYRQLLGQCNYFKQVNEKKATKLINELKTALPKISRNANNDKEVISEQNTKVSDNVNAIVTELIKENVKANMV